MARQARYEKQEFIGLLEGYIEEHLKQNINVEKIAGYFGVNVATLRRWCLEYTQLSPRDYLALYRIKKAKTLLQQGQKSLQVADHVGFSQQKTFCSVFKRYEKTSPGQFC